MDLCHVKSGTNCSSNIEIIEIRLTELITKNKAIVALEDISDDDVTSPTVLKDVTIAGQTSDYPLLCINHWPMAMVMI